MKVLDEFNGKVHTCPPFQFQACGCTPLRPLNATPHGLWTAPLLQQLARVVA